MPRRVVIEEFHLTLYVPRDLPPAECRAVRRTLTGAGFRSRLRQAVEQVARRYRSLHRATAALSR